MMLSDAFSQRVFQKEKSPILAWAEQNGKSREFRFKTASVREEYLRLISNAIVETHPYEAAFNAIGAELNSNVVPTQNIDLNGHLIRPLSDDQIIKNDTRFAAVLPGRFCKFTFHGRDWNLNIRASFTSAALEDQGSSSKLWWNFSLAPKTLEGMSPKVVATALKKLEQTADRAHPFLKNAFIEAVHKVHPEEDFSDNSWTELPQRLIVSFTEHDKASLNEFLRFEIFGVSSTQNGTDSGEYEAGRAELKSLVENLGIEDFRSENILSATGAPDTLGVAYRHINESSHVTRLAGFSRRPNGGNPLTGNRLSSNGDNFLANRRLHIHSAARSVSAFVTNQQANLVK